MSAPLPPGMDPLKQYSVILNNLVQAKRIRFKSSYLPDGPKNNETWICNLFLEFKDGMEYPNPPLYTACGKSQGKALNVASYLLLASIESA
ncbi:hypothetical protein FRB94_005427 [Tulasnella sp. JGI-2019a]|nr:hypothetical protein FRB94_005427 [Tulasnella sp. JGI-2019a]